MANPPRVKGTRAESAAARWLTGLTGVEFRRNPLAGNADKGDVRGDGIDWLVVEVKNTKIPSPKAWARELAAEMRNAGAEHGVILWSPPGVGMNSVDDWVALIPTMTCSYVYLDQATIGLYGPLHGLHKFVRHVGEQRALSVEIDGLVALRASSWGMWLCDAIADRAYRRDNPTVADLLAT